MFRASLDVGLFRDVIDALSALVTECRLHTDENGISAIAVDSSNVAMVHMRLNASAFASYECIPPLDLGIDLGCIRPILGMMPKSNAYVDLATTEDGKQLKLRFGAYQHTLRLLDVATIRKDPVKPQMDLPARFDVVGWMIVDTIKGAIAAFGTKPSADSAKIAFAVDPEEKTLTLTSKNDVQEITRVFADQEDVWFGKCASARSVFSLDYLRDMAKSLDKPPKLEIQLGNNHPIQFSWQFAGEHGSLMYLLAPRLEQD